MVFTLLPLTGCNTAGGVRYYLLDSVNQPGGDTPTTAGKAAQQMPRVGIGPLALADYLQRANIVTREQANRVKVSPNHKWAEPLEKGMLTALANDLESRLGNQPVAVHPWPPGTQLDYQIRLDVSRYIADTEAVELHVRWQLASATGRGITGGSSDIREPLPGPGYDEVVAAMSRALGKLADELAAATFAAHR
ncbi:MAG: PqiC family protein [Pseudomonadota bacterium]